MKPAEVIIEADFESCMPDAFRKDPFGYFATHGINIKKGEVAYKEDGSISEDPTAVKDLPNWEDGQGKQISIVAKRINAKKSQIAKTADPFYEYKVMQHVRSFGLPAATPFAKVSNGEEQLIIMERVTGFRLLNSTVEELRAMGWSDEDLHRLKREATLVMAGLEAKFREKGIERPWKLADMVVDIDLQSKKIRSMTPTDWERTKIRQSGNGDDRR